MPTRADFHNLMRRGGDRLVFAPLALDPMTALLAHRAGFEAVYVGGGALGYALGISEALLEAEDLATPTRRIAERLGDNVAIIVDGGVGFGDAVHTARTINVIENAGAHAIEIEDQIAPKRAHHHKGVEHLVSTEEMCGKIKAALDARRDPHFLIIARCNATQSEGAEAAVERANAYAEAGADLLMLRARNDAEFATLTAGTRAPLATLSIWAMKPEAEMRAAGYTLIMDPSSGTVLTYRALSNAFARLRAGNDIGLTRPEIDATMKDVQNLVGLEALYALEAETTERDTYT